MRVKTTAKNHTRGGGGGEIGPPINDCFPVLPLCPVMPVVRVCLDPGVLVALANFAAPSLTSCDALVFFVGFESPTYCPLRIASSRVCAASTSGSTTAVFVLVLQYTKAQMIMTLKLKQRF